MGDGFQRGLWGSGPYGDPDPDAALPEAVADALLDGKLALVPADYRPLTDAMAALCGPPSAAELSGEARARAAYRTLGSGMLDEPGVRSHTLPLDLTPAARPHRAGRARHRSSGPTRPPGRRVMGGRLGLVSGVAAAVIAVTGGFAYATGAFHGHLASRNSAQPSSTVSPSVAIGDGAGLKTASTPMPLHTTTAPATATGSPPTDTPRALCEAWLKNPWQPNAKDWDEEDFDKLSALAHCPQWVLWYCAKILPGYQWGAKPDVHYPARYSTGRWWWTPDGKAPVPTAPPSPGTGPGGQGDSGNSGNQGNNSNGPQPQLPHAHP